jgi:hypothetical protein
MRTIAPGLQGEGLLSWQVTSRFTLVPSTCEMLSVAEVFRGLFCCCKAAPSCTAVVLSFELQGEALIEASPLLTCCPILFLSIPLVIPFSKWRNRV